jgi:dihydrofolate synthase/folylpolyglutamate synthase
VHIAGTNGKGSTSAYISQILLEAGYKVGRYTSPAVFDYLEIFSINNVNISENEYAKLMTDVKNATEVIKKENKIYPTAFELETALAYKYFYDNNCDIVIIETGMGGTYDATNIVANPLVSVITSISMDHMQFLGNTIEEIAQNKAGIIKKRCDVVMALQPESVLKVIKDKAEEENANLITVDKVEEEIYKIDKTCFTYTGKSGEKYDLETTMLGTFQTFNVPVAIEVAEILKEKGLYIYREHIEQGIKNAKWYGRFQKISEKPMIYFDGGHNPAAAENIKNTLEIYFTNKKLVYIIGVLADKDYDKVLSVTASLAEYIITITPPNNQRALDGRELLKVVRKYNENAEYADTLEIAVKRAEESAGNDGVIIIFGSLSYLGKIKNIIE